MKKLILLPLLFLAACATPEEREAARQQREQADIQRCLELGFKMSSTEFADCRLRLQEMRSQERSANRISSSIGYGVYGGRRHSGWGIGHRF